jgi:hypothetical protein
MSGKLAPNDIGDEGVVQAMQLAGEELRERPRMTQACAG